MIDVRQTLDALLAGRTDNATVIVERIGDDAFEASLVVKNSISKTPTFDLEQARGAMKWARDQGALLRVVFSRWGGWQMLDVEGRAKELLRACDAKAERLVVFASEPATERGEEPMGQPAIQLEGELADGTPLEHPLVDAYTSRSDHANVVADFTKRANALAETLGVQVDVRR